VSLLPEVSGVSIRHGLSRTRVISGGPEITKLHSEVYLYRQISSLAFLNILTPRGSKDFFSVQVNQLFLAREDQMFIILVVILVVFLLGGGGWGYSRWRRD
jgi:hypothetical protein